MVSLLLTVGGTAIVLLVSAHALQQAFLVPWAVVLLGLDFAVTLVGADRPAALAAAGYGLVLWLVAELSYAAFERLTPLPADRGTALVRVVRTGVVVVVAGVLDAVALTAGQYALGGLLTLALGLAAAVGVIALAALLRANLD